MRREREIRRIRAAWETIDDRTLKDWIAGTGDEAHGEAPATLQSPTRAQ